MKKILIKIGSSSTLGSNGNLLKSAKNLIKEISILQEKYQVCLITSGAKASFSGYSNIFKETATAKEKEKSRMNLYASGQVFLTKNLFDACKKVKKMLAFLLISRADIDRNKELICKNIQNAITSKESIFCINENDAVTEKVQSLNNDILAKEINSLIKFDFVFILSAVDGVLDENQKTIKILNRDTIHKIKFFQKTSQGTGGMEEKIANCIEISKTGSKCIIASALKKNIITKALNGKIFGTVIDFKE